MEEQPIRILIIEDDEGHVRLVREILKESNRGRFELANAKKIGDAIKLLKDNSYDAVLLDLNLPDSWGFDTFGRLYKEIPKTPIVVLTGLADEELGIRAVQKGAQDYLNKGDMDGNLLTRIILYSIERKRVIDELEISYQKFFNLAAHLQYLREKERKHIAGELHDELGSLFTAIKMELSSIANTDGGNQGTIPDMKESITKLIDKGIEVVRRISSELRPHILDHLGLIPAVNWYVKEFQKRANMRCKWTLSPEDIQIDKDRATAVFRILQEALTNVARHSKASRVTIELIKTGDNIRLKVSDNGVGIDEKKVNDPQSYGLMGIQERVLFLGGDVKFKGVADKGTTVTVKIPVSYEGKRQ